MLNVTSNQHTRSSEFLKPHQCFGFSNALRVAQISFSLQHVSGFPLVFAIDHTSSNCSYSANSSVSRTLNISPNSPRTSRILRFILLLLLLTVHLRTAHTLTVDPLLECSTSYPYPSCLQDVSNFFF